MSNPASPLSRRRAAIAGGAVLAALASIAAGALVLGGAGTRHAPAASPRAKTTASRAPTTHRALAAVVRRAHRTASTRRVVVRHRMTATHHSGSDHHSGSAHRMTATHHSGSGHHSGSARHMAPAHRTTPYGAFVAYVGRPTSLRAAPGGRRIATLRARTSFGSPETVLVARRRGRWLGVIANEAGNHRLGWIPDARASLTRVQWSLRADLAHRRLVVLHDGRVVARLRVGVGAPGSPTPAGRYAVTDRLRMTDPAGPYGCCILALSARAPHHISDWDGGDRIAIHSTTAGETIGRAASHGCIHVTLAEGRWLLARIPLGTPIDIVDG